AQRRTGECAVAVPAPADPARSGAGPGRLHGRPGGTPAGPAVRPGRCATRRAARDVRPWQPVRPRRLAAGSGGERLEVVERHAVADVRRRRLYPARPVARPVPPFQPRRRPMNAAKRYEIFRRLREDNPEPRTELAYTTPFELLIAVILSAQATDVGVNKATARLYPVANTPEAIHALGVEGLSEYIKTIGLYRGKAENVIETCRILIEKHGSQVPDNREDLEALPGVGRKT